MKLKRNNFNGRCNDHYLPRKQSPKQWRKLTAKEFETAPKVLIDGQVCAVRQTGLAHLPFQILRPRRDSFQILDVWAVGDQLEVREKYSKVVLALLSLTDEGLIQVPSTEEAAPYDQAASRHREIDALLASDLPPAEVETVMEERRAVQRRMSALSFADLYTAGHKALDDGTFDGPLFSASLRIAALEKQLLKGTLTPQEVANIQTVLLPGCRQAFIRRTQHLKQKGVL